MPNLHPITPSDPHYAELVSFGERLQASLDKARKSEHSPIRTVAKRLTACLQNSPDNSQTTLLLKKLHAEISQELFDSEDDGERSYLLRQRGYIEKICADSGAVLRFKTQDEHAKVRGEIIWPSVDL